MQHLGLKQRAYNIIKAKLINLELQPGSRIREDILMEEISMSRTPVREAMNLLVAEGFIKSVPRKGLFAIQLSNDEIKWLLDVRECLEKLALQKCIEKIDNQQIEEIKQLTKNFEEALNAEDYGKCNQLDSDFHIAIAKVSANNMLIEFLLRIEELMHIIRNMEKKLESVDMRLDTLKQHKAIFRCIENRDISNAIIEMEKHLKSTKEHLGI